MEQNLQEKYNELLNILRSTGGLAVAFSGGVDSAFLVYAAHEALGGKLWQLPPLHKAIRGTKRRTLLKYLLNTALNTKKLRLTSLPYRAFAKTERSAAITANMRFLQKLKKQRKNRVSALWLTAPIPMTKAITALVCAPRRNLAF